MFVSCGELDLAIYETDGDFLRREELDLMLRINRLVGWRFAGDAWRHCDADCRADRRKSATVRSGGAFGEDSQSRHPEGRVEAVSRLHLHVRMLCEGSRFAGRAGDLLF